MCVWTWTGNIILYFNWLYVHFVAYAQLSEGPVSVSALVGENAQFHCSGSGIIIAWIVDGYLATDSVIVERGITPDTPITSSGTVQSTLTVPATLENNGTAVWCRLISINGSITSKNATLTVLPGELMQTAV